jgi:succinoglycan biosynthesis protein ExoA
VKISVIIPCRNERRHICQFLDSLLAQEVDPDWKLEILVADGLSDDGTRDLLRQYSERNPEVRRIDNPGRIVSTGLNAAIQAARGEVIIRMDAHTTYARDYIRQCVTVLRESGADNVGGPWVAEGCGTIGRAIAAAFQSPFCTGGGKAHDPKHEGEVDTVYLGCWRRSVFDRIGLFDPELVRNQDDELNFRLRRAGGRIWQSPRIKSSYAARGSLASLFRQYLQYGFWKVAVMRKHRALASWRHAVPPLFVSSIPTGVLVIALASALGMTTLAGSFAAAVAAVLGVYFLACAAAAMKFAGRLEIRALLLLPVVISTYQVAYGLGFLAGMCTLRKRPSGANPAPAYFTALTR